MSWSRRFGSNQRKYRNCQSFLKLIIKSLNGADQHRNAKLVLYVAARLRAPKQRAHVQDRADWGQWRRQIAAAVALHQKLVQK